MTATANILARLGLALSGTNEDLEVLHSDEDESKSEGAGSDSGSESDEDEEDESEGAGSSDEDEEDESDEDFEGSSGSSDEDSEDESDADNAECDADGEDDEDSEDESDANSGDDSEDEGEDDSDENGEDESDGEDDREDGECDAPEPGDESDTDSGSEEDDSDSHDAGGHTDLGEIPDEIGKDLLEAIENGEKTDLTDSSEALSEAIKDQLDADANDCLPGEMVWRPYDPSLDTVKFVSRGEPGTAKYLQDQVKHEISFLRSKLRSKFLQARAPKHLHGVRKGRELSERRLVSSVVELRSGQRPTRPDWLIEEKPECTLAAAVVIDESGSMSGLRTRAAMAALAIATPLSELGSPCMVCGPRNGQYSSNYVGRNEGYSDEGHSRFHRRNGIRIDVFKDWDEDMRKALPRFSRVQATGSTPLEDGIQYALQSLSKRPERHRVVIVVTDGCPDNSAVCRRLIRLAEESGVTVVGVGISAGCHAVKDLFPVAVAVEQLSELPREMLAVLDGIMFPKVGGKKVRLEGAMNTKVSR